MVIKKMLKKLFSFSAIFFGITTSLISQPVKASNPYGALYIGTGINFCAAEYGLLSDNEAFDYVNAFMKENYNLEPYQVYNLMQRKGFWSDVSKYIKKSGGCKNIAADLKERMNARSSSFAGTKPSYDYIYKVD